MGIAVGSSAAPMDIRALHRRMGRVYHQPVRVRSFTNKESRNNNLSDRRSEMACITGSEVRQSDKLIWRAS